MGLTTLHGLVVFVWPSLGVAWLVSLMAKNLPLLLMTPTMVLGKKTTVLCSLGSLNSMARNVRALFDHCPMAYAVWEAARKTYTVTQNSSKLYQLHR